MWRKSSACTGSSGCVEVSALPDGGMAMRDGKNPDGPWLEFTRAEWDAFTAGVRAGEFDLPDTDASGGDGPREAPASTETRRDAS